jgi:hypothetical protein
MTDGRRFDAALVVFYFEDSRETCALAEEVTKYLLPRLRRPATRRRSRAPWGVTNRRHFEGVLVI